MFIPESLGERGKNLFIPETIGLKSTALIPLKGGLCLLVDAMGVQ